MLQSFLISLFAIAAQLLQESGRYEDALTLLDTDAKWFVNRTEWSIKRATMLTLLARYDEALPIWKSHLDVNPENYAFHRGLQCCILKTPDLLTLTGCKLPTTEMDLSAEQVMWPCACLEQQLSAD